MVAKSKIIKSLPTDNNYILLGIVSSVNDYRLAWLLNNKFNIDLKKCSNIEVTLRQLEEKLFYSLYSSKSNEFSFLSNKDSNSVKLLKLNFDYFIKINNESITSESIKKQINEINEITFIIEINSISKIDEKTINKINNYFIF